jgi:hypothetical protein
LRHCAWSVWAVAGPAGVALAGAPVHLSVDDVTLVHAATLRVGLASADGQARRVRLVVSHEGGLRPLPVPPVDLPPSGAVTVDVPLFRGDAPWGSRHEVEVVALDADQGTTDGAPLGLATAIVQVAADPAWLPRLRLPLLLAGAGLLAAAGFAEWRRARGGGPS